MDIDNPSSACLFSDDDDVDGDDKDDVECYFDYDGDNHVDDDDSDDEDKNDDAGDDDVLAHKFGMTSIINNKKKKL